MRCARAVGMPDRGLPHLRDRAHHRHGRLPARARGAAGRGQCADVLLPTSSLIFDCSSASIGPMTRRYADKCTASVREKIEMEDHDIRAALDRHWAASDANDFEAEHQIYREDAVLEYPQSGERIRGRRNIQASRSAQPNRK